MTPLLLMLACGVKNVDFPDEEEDTDTDADGDGDTDTRPAVCAPALWSWHAENTVATAEASFDGAAPQAEAGIAIEAGDINGDGGNDLMIDAMGAADGNGATYFLLGGVERVLDQPLDGRPSFVGDALESMGYAVSAVGDLNGDGLQDIFQSPYNDGRQHTGHVILGHTGSWTVGAGLADADAALTNITSDGTDFTSPYFLGDYDGDGQDDLLLSGFVISNGEMHVVSGADIRGDMDVPTDDTAWVIGGAERVKLSGVGDFDGDGRPDFLAKKWYDDTDSACYVLMADDIAGAHGDEFASLGRKLSFPPGTNTFCSVLPDIDGDGDDEISTQNFERSEAFLFTDSSHWTDGMTTADADVQFDWTGPGWPTALGDINGDGLDDIGVTRTVAESGGAFEGYVFFGRATWPSVMNTDDADVAIEPGATNWSYFRWPEQAQKGDVNGDGINDLVLREGQEPVDGFVQAGRVYVYLGGASWTHDRTLAGADVVFKGDRTYQHLDQTALVEDVDNDGCDDFLTGSMAAPDYTGQVFVMFGQNTVSSR